MDFLKKNWILVLIAIMVLYLFYNQYTTNARKKAEAKTDEKEKATVPPPKFGDKNLNNIVPDSQPKTKG